MRIFLLLIGACVAGALLASLLFNSPLPAPLQEPLALASLALIAFIAICHDLLRRRRWDRQPLWRSRLVGAPCPDTLDDFPSAYGIGELSVNMDDVQGTRTGGFATVKGNLDFARVRLDHSLGRMLDFPELRVVVSHELGHLRYPSWTRDATLLLLAVLIWVTFIHPYLLASKPLPPSYEVGIMWHVPVFLLRILLVFLLARPLLLWIERRNEMRCHRFALEVTDDPDAFESVMRKLAEAGGATGEPGLIDKMLIYTHPSLSECLALAAEYRASRATGEADGQSAKLTR